MWDIPGVLACIATFITDVKDLLAFRAVAKAWRHAAQDSKITKLLTSRSFGRAAALGVHNTTDLSNLCTAFHTSWMGLCEDAVTNHGLAYSMELQGLVHHQHRPSAVHQRTGVGIVNWNYAEPHPKTRVKVIHCAAGREVWGRHVPDTGLYMLMTIAQAQLAGQVLPLYSRRVKLIEYEKLAGNVDVPNHYHCFQVGPVLLGCFLPPLAPLCLLHLNNVNQMLGLVVLWPAHIQAQLAQMEQSTHQDSAPSSASGAWRPAAHQEAGPAGHDSMATMCDPTAEVKACPTDWLLSTAAGVGLASPWAWLAWQGLLPGISLTGTVLCKFYVRNTDSEMWCGHVCLGAIQMVVRHVTPLPANSSLPAGVRLHLHVHLPEREWGISGTGIPGLLEGEEESYTAPITCLTVVDCTPDGKLWPVQCVPLDKGPAPPAPQWNPDLLRHDPEPHLRVPSCSPHPVGTQEAEQAGKPVQSLRGDLLGAEGLSSPQVLKQKAALLHMMLGECLNLTGRRSSHPELVDWWCMSMEGLAMGGVVAGLLTHPVLGRAAFCVAQGGHKALCPMQG